MNRPKKELIREAILESAQAIAASEGWQAVTMRRVAEDIHYTAPVVYEHFTNKEALLMTLSLGGYEQLHASFQKIVTKNEEPTYQLHELGKAYWQFAIGKPRLYELMTGRGSVGLEHTEECEKVAKQCLGITEQTISRILRADTLRSEVHTKAVSLWALLHGLLSLVDSSQIPVSEAYRSLDAALVNIVEQKKG